MVLSGTGLACLPVRVMREYVVAGAVRELTVAPTVPGYEVWACYQEETLRSGLRQVVDMTRSIIAEYQLYV
jgi:DNA-binding transcriptional LysR family regulator